MPVTLGKGVLQAIPPNSKGVIVAGAQLFGSGVPADALGNLGDRYFDTAAQRWYLKRWVANFSGPDSVSVAGIPIIGANNWTFEALIWLDPSTTDWSTIFSGSDVAAHGSTMLRAQSNNRITTDYYGYQGAFVDIGRKSAWYKVIASGTYDGATLADSVSIVGVGTKNSSVTRSDRLPGNGLHLGPPSGGTQFVGRMCNVKASGSGYVLHLPIDDGAGTAVRDVSGGNHQGTVTDGSPTTFWIQSWVPMDLLV